MKVKRVFCDRCGKELEPYHDYEDMQINCAHFFEEKDLCAQCVTELVLLFDQFINKKASTNPIKDIKIIVKENETRLDFDEESGAAVVKRMSTVGVKLHYNGEEYGDYIVFNKPMLKVSDVVEVANEIFYALLSAPDYPKEGEGNE